MPRALCVSGNRRLSLSSVDVEHCDQCESASTLTPDSLSSILNCLRRRGRLAVVRNRVVLGPDVVNTTLYRTRLGVLSSFERRW